MAIAETKLMTAEEFFEFVHRPENADRYFELDRGVIIEMPVPTKYHGFVCGNTSRILGNFATRRKKGYVCTNDTGFIVERDPDSVRGPDVSFYEDDQTAETMDRRYTEQSPKLTVEVLSPSDKWGKVMRRINQILKKRVPLVWLIDPEARSVTVYRPGKEHYVVEEHEELTGEDVLPDFRCRVAEFFALPGQQPNS